MRDKLFFEFDEEKRKKHRIANKVQVCGEGSTRAFAERIKSGQTFTSNRKPNTHPRMISLPVASCCHSPQSIPCRTYHTYTHVVSSDPQF